MKTLLLLSLIVIAILLALLYFNHKASKESDVDYKQMREAYEDSLRRHHNVQARLKSAVITAEEARDSVHRKDSLSAIKYINESSRLKIELRKARTAHVDSLLTYDSELQYYIQWYDSVNVGQELRINALEVEKRTQDILCDNVINLKDSLYASKTEEALFLAGEVDKRDAEIKKLKKKLKKRTWLMWIFGGANAIPRGK